MSRIEIDTAPALHLSAMAGQDWLLMSLGMAELKARGLAADLLDTGTDVLAEAKRIAEALKTIEPVAPEALAELEELIAEEEYHNFRNESELEELAALFDAEDRIYEGPFGQN